MRKARAHTVPQAAMVTRHSASSICLAALLAATAHAQPNANQASLRARAEDLAHRTAALTKDAATLAKDATVTAAGDVRDHVATNLDAWYAQAHALAREARTRGIDALDRAITRGEKPLGLFALDPAAAANPSMGSALRWAPLPAAAPNRVVLLVHGLDESGDIWDDLAPAAAAAGHAIVRFEYPNDQPIAISADAFADALATLRARGVAEVDIVAHSMGGLVVRDVLTRPALYASDARATPRLPAITRVIAMGTPHQGSPWARLQPIAEGLELLARIEAMGDTAPLLAAIAGHDADGRAARDLHAGSDFLSALDARPQPTHVDITSIVGDLHAARTVEGLVDWKATERRLAPLLGQPRATDWTTRAMLATLTASQTLGDGVVPTDSAVWPALKASHVVIVRAGHRGMIRASSPDTRLASLGLTLDPTPAIPVILDALATPRTQ